MSNLSLTDINGSDKVDPSVINDNFNKVDAIGKEYVVDCGFSGNWYYRKYNTGIAECFINDLGFPNQDRTQKWGDGMYRTGPISFGAYPFAFVQRPIAIVSQNSVDGGNLGGYIFYDSTASLTVSPNFRSVDSVSCTIGHPRFGIYVVGRWK